MLLRRLVDAHVALGQPVGSKWLAEQADLPWGPSTIRAELARLEELGLLGHPHTSAGRVPTDHGYRQYVDTLLEEDRLPVRTPGVHLSLMRREVFGVHDFNDAPAIEELSLERVDCIAGPRGAQRAHDAATRSDCPIVPELLRPID